MTVQRDNENVSNAQPPSISQKWRWSANVILIGTSQSGKSTLINRFRTLAVGPHPLPDPALVGQGTTSCTRDPFIYEYDIPMTDFVLTSSSSAIPVDVPSDEKSIFDFGFWKRKDLVLQQRNPKADLARIRLIDTPGLDDNNPAKNAPNIESVLRLIKSLSKSKDLDCRHISAVMFVMKESQPFHDSLQTWYHYYKRCMPNLFGSVAVVNTNFRFRTWKTEYATRALSMAGMGADQPDSRHAKMKARREAWGQIFKSDPTHFFIDSKPAPNSAFENYVSANTVFDMLLYLRSQGRLPIENIRLAKFRSMSSIDAKVAGYLRQICQAWEDEKETLVSSLSNAHQNIARHGKNIANWGAELEDLERQVKELDTDVQYDLNTYNHTTAVSVPDRIWKFFTFSGHEGAMSIKEDVFPFEVAAPDNDSTTWLFRSKAKPDTKTWTGQYRSKWTKIPHFSNRSYTTNKTYYASKISKARKRILEIDEDIAETTEIIAKETRTILRCGSSMDENPKVQQLTNFIVRANKHIRRLQETDVPLRDGFSPSAICRYAKSIDQVNYDDVLQFIVEVEPNLRPMAEVEIDRLKNKDL